MASTTSNYALPYPQNTDPVNVAVDIQNLATKIDTDLQEIIEDKSAAMWTGGTFNNGLGTPTYNDTTGKMSMSLSQDLQSTASPSFAGITVNGTGIILANSATNALRITQVGAGNALVVEDDTNPDSTPFVVSASGNVGIGTTSPTAPLEIAFSANDGFITRRSNAATTGSDLVLYKSRGTASSPTATQANDYLGGVNFRGYGATQWIDSGRALIAARASETWTDTANGTYLSFFTTTTGTATRLERVRIDNTGYVGIGVTSPTAFLSLTASTTSAASLNVAHGTAPTAPNNGDVWTTTAGMYVQVNGSTVGPLAAGGGTTTNPLSLKFDSGTTEGTDLYTFNGSASKTVDIKAGTNITLTKTSGSITIASSATATTDFVPSFLLGAM
jgi:hypothetical protein